MSSSFDKLALPPRIYVLKDALNHFLVHSSAKDSLRSAENMASSLSLHFGRQADGGGGGKSPPGYATGLRHAIGNYFELN